MAIKAVFSPDIIRKHGNDYLLRIEAAIISQLQYMGEECVNYARSRPAEIGFKDVTGNLRSSMGYTVYNNGNKVVGKFETVGSGLDGTTEGQRVADKVAKGYKSGFVLVVVAGMNYAVYVESLGRDVLSGAAMLAEKKLPDLLKQLTKNINNAVK